MLKKKKRKKKFFGICRSHFNFEFLVNFIIKPWAFKTFSTSFFGKFFNGIGKFKNILTKPGNGDLNAELKRTSGEATLLVGWLKLPNNSILIKVANKHYNQALHFV